MEDAAVWGVGAGRARDWPRWLLVAAGVAGMVGTSGYGASLLAGTAKLGLAVAAGGLLGEYLALEVAPAQVPLQALLVASSLLVLAFIALLRTAGEKRRAPRVLPLVLLSWAGCAIATLILQATLPLPVLAGSRRLYPDSVQAVEAARSAATRTSLLAVFGAHGLLMAFALKLKIAAVLRRRRGRGGADDGARVGGGAEPYFEPPPTRAAARSGGGGHSVFLTYCRALRRDASVAAVIEALAAQGLGWAPSLANAVLLAVFGLGLAINPTGAPEAVFMLSPVLLMLSQDPLLCWGVASRQRYAPPVLAAAGYLALRASLDITGMSLHRELFWASASASGGGRGRSS